MSKKVFVLGGTGFLGYYTIKELLNRGYEVSTVSLPPAPAENMFPKEVKSELCDFNTLTDAEILERLEGVHGIMYAAGVDERIVPAKPATRFFYVNNVLPTQRLARLAREAGVKKFVVYGSYFSEFAERLPEFELNKQPYTCTRLLQEQVAFAEGDGAMDVTILRLPYIFGTMPGRKLVWQMFTDMARGQAVYPALSGGTAMVTVEQVAEAAIGAMEHGKHRGTYAISGENMKYKEFYDLIIEALGQQETTDVPVVTYDAIKANVEAGEEATHAEGKEHGIQMTISAMLQDRDLYLDPQDTFPILNVKMGDVRSAIKASLKQCVEDPQ